MYNNAPKWAENMQIFKNFFCSKNAKQVVHYFVH